MNNRQLQEELGVCDHRFNALVVPHDDTFVLVQCCLRCPEVVFTKYIDELEDSLEDSNALD